ncbi:MAG: hypothetical protein Q9184_006892 [Pyrenodesmia sp. 2 TL-2023]
MLLLALFMAFSVVANGSLIPLNKFSKLDRTVNETQSSLLLSRNRDPPPDPSVVCGNYYYNSLSFPYPKGAKIWHWGDLHIEDARTACNKMCESHKNGRFHGPIQRTSDFHETYQGMPKVHARIFCSANYAQKWTLPDFDKNVCKWNTGQILKDCGRGAGGKRTEGFITYGVYVVDLTGNGIF